MSSRTVNHSETMKSKGVGQRFFTALMSIILVVGLLPTLNLQNAYAADGDTPVSGNDATVVGNGTRDGSAPMCATYDYGTSVMLYTADELTSAEIEVGTISEIAFNCTDVVEGITSDLNIYMANTDADKTSLSVDSDLSFSEGDLTEVYSENSTAIGATAGWETRELSTQFDYTGGGLLVVVSHSLASSATSSGIHYASDDSSENLCVAAYSFSETSAANPYTLTSTTSDTYKESQYRPNIQLTFGESSDEPDEGTVLTVVEEEKDGTVDSTKEYSQSDLEGLVDENPDPQYYQRSAWTVYATNNYVTMDALFKDAGIEIGNDDTVKADASDFAGTAYTWADLNSGKFYPACANGNSTVVTDNAVGVAPVIALTYGDKATGADQTCADVMSDALNAQSATSCPRNFMGIMDDGNTAGNRFTSSVATLTVTHSAEPTQVVQTWEIGSPTASDVTATLYGNGSMVVEGTGNTETFTMGSGRNATPTTPWYSDYRDDITSVTFGDDVATTNLNYWFYNCTNLEAVPDTLPNTATSMQYTFYGCNSITSLDNVKIPENMVDMSYAFSDADGIKTVKDMDIPDTVTNMSYVFDDCEGLESLDGLTIPENVTNLNFAFRFNTSLTSAEGFVIKRDETDPVALTMQSTFYYDSALTTLGNFVIPNGVTSLSSTFNGCSTLEELPEGLTIPASVTTMNSAFTYCSALKSLPEGFKIEDGSASLDMGNCFNNCTTLESLGEFTIPSRVTTIGSMCTGDKALTTLDGVTFAEDSKLTNISYAFQNCSSLADLGSFAIPSSVTNMNYAFDGCTSLTNLPKGFSIPSGASTTNAFRVSSPYSSSNLLTTYCDKDDLETLSDAYNWAGSNRELLEKIALTVVEKGTDGETLKSVDYTQSQLDELVSEEASDQYYQRYSQNTWKVYATNNYVTMADLFENFDPEITISESDTVEADASDFTGTAYTWADLNSGKFYSECAHGSGDVTGEGVEVAPIIALDFGSADTTSDNITCADVMAAALADQGNPENLAECPRNFMGIMGDPADNPSTAGRRFTSKVETLTIQHAADKSELEADIATAEALDESAYTADSWKDLQDALEAAKEVDAKANATQDEVDAADAALKSAIDNLVKVADKTDLEADIATAEGLDESAYTADSWKDLQDALDAAKEVDADANASQDAVDAADKALKSAIDNLKELITITYDMFDVDTSYVIYSGSGSVTKSITSDLTEGVDYTVSYENNDSAGTAKIIIEGIGDYTGTLEYTFKIIHYFEDVGATVNDTNEWYFDAVYGMVDLDAITGYSETIFGVGDSMTRAQLVTIMWRYCEPDEYANYDEKNAKDTTGLPDAQDGMYYTGAVNWAYANGIITGNLHDDGTYTFNPDDPVTFDQLVTIVARYSLGSFGAAANYPQTALDTGAFTDKDTVESYARGAMSWAIDNKLVTGNNNHDNTYTLDPLSNVARERAVTVVYRAIEAGLVAPQD